MDYLRSCYSTKVQMQPGGPEVDVDWFFNGDETTLFPQRHAFGSLNWTKPRYGTGSIGEVVGAARPYRNGAAPSYWYSGGSRLGTYEQFSTGADMLMSPSNIDWHGRRLSQLGVGTHSGRFPLYGKVAGMQPALASSWGVTYFPQYMDMNFAIWEGFGGGPNPTVYWIHSPTDPYFSCWPGMATLFIQAGGRSWPLRCTVFNPPYLFSRWTDPESGTFPAGGFVTLYGPQVPPYPPFV